MRITAILVSATLVPLLVLALPVGANGVVSVDAIVFPEVVSIEIPAGCPDSIDYGALPYGAVNQDPRDNPTLCVRNNGSVDENFHIYGYDAAPSDGDGITWTLAWDPCNPGSDQFVHKFAPGDTTVGATFSCLSYSAGDNKLADGVAPGETQDFKLRIDMPTESSSYEEHTTTVNVVANAL